MNKEEVEYVQEYSIKAGEIQALCPHGGWPHFEAMCPNSESDDMEATCTKHYVGKVTLAVPEPVLEEVEDE